MTAPNGSISLSAKCKPDQPDPHLHAEPIEACWPTGPCRSPGDPSQAELHLSQCTEPELAEIAADPTGLRLLKSVFGNSPFLARCLLRDPTFARAAYRFRIPSRCLATLIQELHPRALPNPLNGLDESALMQRLRIARRRSALLIALCDIGGVWPLERLTGRPQPLRRCRRARDGGAPARAHGGRRRVGIARPAGPASATAASSCSPWANWVHTSSTIPAIST